MALLDHLLDPTAADFIPSVDKHVRVRPTPIPLKAEIEARKNTAALISEWERASPQEIRKAEDTARAVFAGEAPLKELVIPESVQKLDALLSRYDHDLIQDARRMRNFVANRLLEESDNPDPKIRLKAIELIGKLTDVGAFTERIETKSTNLSADELDRAIKEKLQAITRHISPGASEPPEDARVIK